MPRLLPSTTRRVASAVSLLAVAAACGHAPREPDTWAWRGSVPAGEWLRIRNATGAVRVAGAAGGDVRVSARKRYRGRRPEPVRFVVEREGGGVVVCAVWGRSGGTCGEDGHRRRRGGPWWRRLLDRGDDVAVEFLVALPPGVRLDASTLNGGVTVADATAEVRARSVNGSVTVDARGGPVAASTVNGRIIARVGELAPGAGVALESVNGSVTAMLPASMDGELDLRTTNGSVSSDFPLAVQRADRRHIQATLGAGGRRLSLKTVNGTVRLERAAGPVAASGAASTR